MTEPAPSGPKRIRRFWSLRSKLVVAGLGVQTLVTLLIVLTEIRTTEQSVGKELADRVRHSAPLLNAALVDPLLQRDYATLNQVLAETQDPQNYKYLLLLDRQGKPLASAGSMLAANLPAVDQDFLQLPWDRADGCLHLSMSVVYRDAHLATLRYGVSLEPMRTLRNALVRSSVLVAILGLLIGTAAFAAIGMGLTRGLRQLTRSSEKVKRGEYDLFVDSQGSDELAQLASAFNGMARAVHERVTALQASETLQAVYLKQARNDKARLQSLLHAMELGVLLVDQDQRLLYANQAFATLWELDLKSLEQEFDQRRPVPQSLLWRSPHPALSALLRGELTGTTRAGNVAVKLLSGQEIQVSSSAVLDNAGEAIGHLWLFEDVTAEKQTQSLIHRLAERDSLTGLLNRHTFNKGLSAVIEEKNPRLALFFVDLDGFKLINDLNGHALGDRLLKSVANALNLTFRPEDAVARLGGDEFAIAMRGLSREQLATVCERLLRNVANASGAVMAFSSNPVKISCSIGVAWFPEDAQDADALLAAADQAMYAAKDAGRNTWRQYQPQFGANVQKSQWLTWSQRLNDAFENNRFQVYLQGIFHAKSAAIDHYEALVRLPTPEGGHYPIGELILHAEDSGKVQALDRYMLLRCVALLASQPEHPPIAVNISSRTVVDASLADYVQGCLAAEGVDPRRLHLELTETAALTNIEQATRTVSALQAMGCLVGLDDFGSGFTSFTYLRDLRVDYIKMDGGFIRGLAGDRECQILLKAVVDIAHASGRSVIAEWVEDQATLDLVQSYDVDLVQGFLLGRPRPAV